MKSTPQRLKTALTSLRLGVLMNWDSPIDSGPVPDSETAFDVIVVGGGPGGSGAAGYMAMKGLKVLLLEKAIWPRDKTCGDAVGGKSLKHVEELGVKQKTRTNAALQSRFDRLRWAKWKGGSHPTS